MMPFLGVRVQAYKQDSYSEKKRNQTSGQNIPPYKMWGCCKELVDAQSPTILYGEYGEFLKNTHSFCEFFARPRSFSYKSRGLNPWGDTHRFMCAPVFAKGMRIDTRTCYIIYTLQYCFLEQPINTRHLSTLSQVWLSGNLWEPPTGNIPLAARVQTNMTFMHWYVRLNVHM